MICCIRKTVGMLFVFMVVSGPLFSQEAAPIQMTDPISYPETLQENRIELLDRYESIYEGRIYRIWEYDALLDHLEAENPELPEAVAREMEQLRSYHSLERGISLASLAASAAGLALGIPAYLNDNEALKIASWSLVGAGALGSMVSWSIGFENIHRMRQLTLTFNRGAAGR